MPARLFVRTSQRRGRTLGAIPKMKEDVFQPIAELHGDPRQPGEGRRSMIERSLRNLPLLFRLCPELQDLRDRIAAHLGEA